MGQAFIAAVIILIYDSVGPISILHNSSFCLAYGVNLWHMWYRYNYICHLRLNIQPMKSQSLVLRAAALAQPWYDLLQSIIGCIRSRGPVIFPLQSWHTVSDLADFVCHHPSETLAYQLYWSSTPTKSGIFRRLTECVQCSSIVLFQQSVITAGR